MAKFTLAISAAAFGGLIALSGGAVAGTPGTGAKPAAETASPVQKVGWWRERRNHVRAPFTDVDTDGDGARVRAPFVDVDTQGRDTHVRAPFVNLFVPKD